MSMPVLSPMAEMVPAAIADRYLTMVRLDVRSATEPLLAVWPDPFRSKANHYVLWWCPDHPFTIAFQERHPVDGEPVLEAEYDAGSEWYFVVARMRGDAVLDEGYKYTVTATVQKDGTAHVEVLDPIGIVEKDPEP